MNSSMDRNSVSTDLLWKMYSTMYRIRAFEERVADLVVAREINTPCHLYIGQEAIATGICAALETRDYVWGGHRSHGHYLAKGGEMKTMLAEIFGRTGGCAKGRGGSMHLIARDVGILGTVPLVAATIPLAAGTGLSSKISGDGRVTVSFFGDGALEEGHAHESINLAALYLLPVVFVCENNLYASHMQLLERRAADNIYKTGEAHGVPSVVLDGNDVVALHEAAIEAVNRARAGGGPTFLECRTYRWRGHVGPSWDMDVGLKRRDELDDWLPKDPIARARTALIEAGASHIELDSVARSALEEIDEAVTFARQSPHPSHGELLEHVFCSADGVR